MANLWTGTVKSKTTYTDLATESELTFTNGTTYCIQVQNPCYIREGETGDGFLCDTSEPFEWTAGDDSLYIKTILDQCIVNIAG